MPANVVLSEVEWHACGSDGYPYYRCCDFCYETAVEDITAGKSEPEFRRFYELLGECGCIVCDNCLPDLLAGKFETEEAHA